MKSLISAYKVGLFEEALQKFFKPKAPPLGIPEFGGEIFLPGQNGELHNGFVNCKDNKVGLKASFYSIDGKKIGIRWANQVSGYEGYPGIIHGGITASLLDELMTNTVFHNCGKFGVTVKAKFKWHKTLKIGDPVVGFGELRYANEEFARVTGTLFRSDDKLVATSEGVFYFPTEKQFKRLAELSSVPTDIVKYFRAWNSVN